LFFQHTLYDVLRAQEQAMFKEIDSIEGNRLLNTSIDDLCDYFEQRYKIEALRLREDEITVDQNEVPVDVSRDPGRAIFDRSRPFYLKGTKVSFFIPFDGEKDCFKFRPVWSAKFQSWSSLTLTSSVGSPTRRTQDFVLSFIIGTIKTAS
jgi:hypothetical protein